MLGTLFTCLMSCGGVEAVVTAALRAAVCAGMSVAAKVLGRALSIEPALSGAPLDSACITCAAAQLVLESWTWGASPLGCGQTRACLAPRSQRQSSGPQ